MSFKLDTKFWLIATIVFFAAFSRLLLLGVPNVSPVTAIALFGGAYFGLKRWAYLVPFLAMWMTDLILNNTVYAAYFDGFVWYGNLWVYASFMLIVALGTILLKRVSTFSLLAASITASLLFFMVTNFGSWASGAMYPKTFAGLMASYSAGLPFLRFTVLGDLLCTTILFGLYELYKSKAFKLEKAEV